MNGLIEKYKYPILVLIAGLLLLAIPGEKSESKMQNDDLLLQQLLSEASGVGEAHLISSPQGVVISCEGADSASVRLDIIRAVKSYTGFSADKITILKLSN